MPENMVSVKSGKVDITVVPKLRCSVIIEKPFTPSYSEADELISLAKEKNRLLSVYHSQYSIELGLYVHSGTPINLTAITDARV